VPAIRSRATLVATIFGGVLAIGLISGCGAAGVPIAAPVPVTVTATSRVTTVATVPVKVTTTVPTTVSAPPITVTATATVTEQAPPVTVKATPAGIAGDGTFGDGTYLVGTQIQPGNYQASSPNGSALCYWEVNDSVGGIIDNGLDEGVMFVPGDGFSVHVADCGTWTPVG
jgi:hypothetical protein